MLMVKIHFSAPKGMTDDQLYKFLNIGRTTYYDLKASNPDFSDVIKEYRDISVIEVLNSFKKIATGFNFTEKTKELQKNKETGKYELVVTKEVDKYIAPNAQAGMFYLKNRDPERFKDKIDHDHNFKGGLENITFVIKGKS